MLDYTIGVTQSEFKEQLLLLKALFFSFSQHSAGLKANLKVLYLHHIGEDCQCILIKLQGVHRNVVSCLSHYLQGLKCTYLYLAVCLCCLSCLCRGHVPSLFSALCGWWKILEEFVKGQGGERIGIWALLNDSQMLFSFTACWMLVVNLQEIIHSVHILKDGRKILHASLRSYLPFVVQNPDNARLYPLCKALHRCTARQTNEPQNLLQRIAFCVHWHQWT